LFCRGSILCSKHAKNCNEIVNSVGPIIAKWFYAVYIISSIQRWIAADSRPKSEWIYFLISVNNSFRFQCSGSVWLNMVQLVRNVRRIVRHRCRTVRTLAPKTWYRSFLGPKCPVTSGLMPCDNHREYICYVIIVCRCFNACIFYLW